MNLEEFIKLEEEHDISPDDAQSLNKDLATKSISDIPEGHRARVEGYLTVALNMNSVEHDIRASLDSLLSDLQNVI
jgi:ethanolamine utilization microcompartment shell protein EutS